MTEDDTFRDLRKIPKIDMTEILIEFYRNHVDLQYEEWIVEKVLLLKRYGWTIYEYNKV